MVPNKCFLTLKTYTVSMPFLIRICFLKQFKPSIDLSTQELFSRIQQQHILLIFQYGPTHV